MFRRFAAAVLFTLIGACGASHAFPDKPITVIVPFSAGTGTDVNAREFAQALTALVKQPVVVENRTGADGAIAAQALMAAPADGHTLLFASSSLWVLDPLMKKSLAYEPFRDFAPVCGVARIPIVMVVSAVGPYQSVAASVAAAKAQPGKLTLGAPSPAIRVAGELFAQAMGIKLLPVPYRSTVTALTELSAGQLDMMHMDLTGALPFIQSGKIKPLMWAGSERNKALPEVPAATELGVPNYDARPWFAVYTSSKTPPAALAQLREAVGKTLQQPEVSAGLVKRGLEPFQLCGDALGKHHEQEFARTREMLTKAGIVAQ